MGESETTNRSQQPGLRNSPVQYANAMTEMMRMEEPSVDMKSFRTLIRSQIESGVSGIVVCGTTGESPTIHDDEYEELIRTAVSECGGRIPVVAGAGSNCSISTVRRCIIAKHCGASAAMVVTPYYNRPTSEGIVEHFRFIQRHLEGNNSIPLMTYNVPSRTGVDMQPEVLERIIRECPLVVAHKEASGVSGRYSKLSSMLRPHKVCLFSGEDGELMSALRNGAQGIISVISNAFPRYMSDICRMGLRGDFDTAEKQFQQIRPLIERCSTVPNPLPIKYMLQWLGMMPHCFTRLPLTQMTSSSQKEICDAIERTKSKIQSSN